MSLFKSFINYSIINCSKTLTSSPSLRHYSTNTGCHDNNYPLPWPHHTKMTFPSGDPLFHRLAGLFLLKRIIKASGYKFNTTEFLSGVKDAITSFSKLIFSDNWNVLKDIVHPDLYTPLSASLSSLSLKPHLQLETIRNLSLIGVRSIVGVAPPDDRHVISYMGQTLITSQSKMESLMYSNGKVTVHSAKEIGEQATAANMEFVMTVSFNTRERYYVTDTEGTVVGGANKIRSSTHQWTFGSVVNWDSEYPLEWKIYNINNYLCNNTEDIN